MRKRIENIEKLIACLNTDQIILTINDLDFNQSELGPLSFEQIRNLITDRYHRSQKDIFEVEEAVLSVSELHTVVFTDLFISDMTERIKHWLIPLESIFEYFNYRFYVNYLDESIQLDFKNYPDFSRRLGVDEDLLLEYAINSIFFNQFEVKILRLWKPINRMNSLNRINQSIKSK